MQQKMIKNVARVKNTGLILNPEILTQPAASGKHIARVLDTPYARNGAVNIPIIVSPTDLSCKLNILSLMYCNLVLLKPLIYLSIHCL